VTLPSFFFYEKDEDKNAWIGNITASLMFAGSNKSRVFDLQNPNNSHGWGGFTNA
jgi:hypothetical protein